MSYIDNVKVITTYIYKPYITFDLLLIISIRATEPTDLVAVQNHYWDPLLEWMKNRLAITEEA